MPAIPYKVGEPASASNPLPIQIIASAISLGGGGGSSLTETLWTDNTNAVFVRLDDGSAVTWHNMAGVTVDAPGAGAKPYSGSATGAALDASVLTGNASLATIAAKISTGIGASALALETGGNLAGILTKLGAVVLSAGSAIIGKVGIDQTTPGTTNGVVVNSGIVTANAGTNLNTSALALETGGNLAGVSTATGTVTDTAYASGSGSVIALLKGIFGKVAGTLGVGAAASAFVDGSDITQGLKADTPYAGSGAATVVSVLKGIYAALTAALPLGSNIIGKVGIDQTAGQNVVVVASASAALPTTETYTHSLMTGGIAVASGTSSPICAARTGRKEVTVILEAATTAIRLRSTNDASATVGARLPGVDGEAITISGDLAVYGAGITGATTVSVIEVW